MAEKIKLSKSQAEVIRMIHSEYELGKSTTCGGGWWLQKGGLGKGGESKKVAHNTAISLYDLGLIDGEYHFPATHYHMTKKGESVFWKLAEKEERRTMWIGKDGKTHVGVEDYP